MTFWSGVFGVSCIPVYISFCFGYITVLCMGCFGRFPARFIFVFVNKNFRVVLVDYFVCPPSYFVVWYIVFCVCVVYVFVYSLSRTWLAPVQRCMYDTCYMSVLSHKIMQKCEKLHNKTLQTTTSVHVN